MKGAKTCIKSLILCITFLLSLNLSLNASAIRKNIYGLNISDVSYNTVNPTTSITDLHLNNTWHPLTNVDVPANSVFRINRLSMKFGQDYLMKQGKKFGTEITIYTSIYRPSSFTNAISNAVCPVSEGGWVIDECETTIEAVDTTLDSIIPVVSGTPIGDTTKLGSTSYINTKYVIKINGHWKNSDTTVRYFNTVGSILTILNPNSFSYGNDTIFYTFNFPAFYTYDEENAEDEAAEKELEDRDNLETQQSSTSTDSNSSQQQAQATGTTLLAAFSSFVSAITSSSPSNCKIDMDMGNLDLGLVDFCTLSPPAPVQTIASIFMILFCVPLSIATARKVISLFRSFQR